MSTVQTDITDTVTDYILSHPTKLDGLNSQPESHYDVIEEGPYSVVARMWTTIEDGEAQWIAVKSASTLRKFTREPHDILKELRLLSDISHPNVCRPAYLNGNTDRNS